MVFSTCCVCRTSAVEAKLFHFPRNDGVRNKWLNLLLPYCPELGSLNKEQLQHRKVCIKHFEKKYLVNLRRTFYSFPTLFSSKEIETGQPTEPVLFEGVHDHTYHNSSFDHTYCSKAEKRLVQGNIATHPQPSSSKQETVLPTTSIKNALVTDANTSPSVKQKVHRVDAARKQHVKLVASKRLLTPRCKKLYEKCKNILKGRKLFGTNSSQKHKISEAEETAKSKIMTQFEKLNNMQKKFINMQLKAVNKKQPSLRYDLDEKLLCIAIYKQSPKGYSLLERMFSLPSKRTLNRVLEKIQFTSGINIEFFKTLKNKTSKWSETKKLCSLVFDEVALSVHTNFVHSKDKIYGFVDEDDQIQFADHALVFMLRGICSTWRQPIAYYFCEGTMPAARLKAIINEVLAAVLDTGLEPLTFICDQGCTFQKALKEMKESSRKFHIENDLPYDNTIFMHDRNISIIYDPPHLLKGIRNNLLTKHMLFNNNIAKWDDIVEIYQNDCSIGQLRNVHKLTDEYIIPEKIKKMKVSYAAKVFSESMGSILRYTTTFATRVNGEEISPTLGNTADVVEFFDRLFDSCNGSRGCRAPGKLRGPVTHSSEHRQFWRDAIVTLRNIKFVDKQQLALTGQIVTKGVPTLKNWITTLEILLRISDILQSKGVRFFYTRNFNQDPLENFFGKIRSYNYRYINPDPYSFCNAYKSLSITNMLGYQSKFSNCEEDVGETIFSLQTLISQTSDNLNPTSSPFEILLPGTSLSEIPESLHQQAVKEKIKMHVRGYTAGYVTRRLKRKFKCTQCNKSLFSKEIGAIHKLIVFRERKNLKRKNLSYSSTKFILEFSKLIDCCNLYLNSNCHRSSILKNIKEMFLSKTNLDWMGCPIHNDALKNLFIEITCKIQIHNWCKSINKILNGAVLKRMDEKCPAVQKLAQKKYIKSRKIKKYN